MTALLLTVCLLFEKVASGVSKGNIRSSTVHKVAIHKFANSFATRKSVRVFSHNLIRPVFVSKPVCNFPSKLVKCIVTCEPVFYVSRKPVKSKVPCKPVYDAPSIILTLLLNLFPMSLINL